MNPALAPFVVEGLLIIVAAVFGFLVGKKGKPYGKVKLIVHLFFAAWFTMGMVFILLGTIKAISTLIIPVAVMAVAVGQSPERAVFKVRFLLQKNSVRV